jgi:hypothetical protein
MNLKTRLIRMLTFGSLLLSVIVLGLVLNGDSKTDKKDEPEEMEED